MADAAADIQVLRELARRYKDVCDSPEQTRRRDLWRDHNSFRRVAPPIYVREGTYVQEVPDITRTECADPFYQQHERWLRHMLFQSTVGDDYTFKPWITQGASCVTPPNGVWGVPYGRVHSEAKRGSWLCDPPLKELDDIDKLVRPHHEIDEVATERNAAKLHEAVGDILPVHVDRAALYRTWHADLSTDLGYLRGIEQVMWDMMDHPEWLHRLVGFMSESVLAVQDQAEAADDWTLAEHENQSMPFAHELPDRDCDSGPVTRDQLWVFVAAQEFTLISPDMHDGFLLQYQLPIMKKFGLVSYGCCEDLTRKIDMLRQIPNLRRIAVAPRADVAKCAQQIGTDYIISWRPNPAEMVCCGFDPAHIRDYIRRGLEACDGCFVDICLKDIETVEHEPQRLAEWVKIVREVIDETVCV